MECERREEHEQSMSTRGVRAGEEREGSERRARAREEHGKRGAITKINTKTKLKTKTKYKCEYKQTNKTTKLNNNDQQQPTTTGGLY